MMPGLGSPTIGQSERVASAPHSSHPASPKPDEAFQEMMKDFVATNAGKSPATRDFQAAVERHMTPNLNATRDGKMDWFFRQ